LLLFLLLLIPFPLRWSRLLDRRCLSCQDANTRCTMKALTLTSISTQSIGNFINPHAFPWTDVESDKIVTRTRITIACFTLHNGNAMLFCVQKKDLPRGQNFKLFDFFSCQKVVFWTIS
jgi:hypothetical protein